MSLYILNMGILPIYSLLKKKNKKYGVFFVGLQLFLILALRDITVGVDLSNYGGGYKFIGGLTFKSLLSRLHLIQTAELVYPYSYESGYCVINWIFSKLGFSFHGFLIICAAFTIISLCIFINKYSSKPWLSFALYIGLGMYEYSFGILRQTLALSILLYGIDFIKQKKFKKFIFIVFIAFTIHRLAILFCVLYFLGNKIITKRLMGSCIFSCIIFLGISKMFYTGVIGRLLSIIGKSTYAESNFSINNQIILMFLIALLILFAVDFDLFKRKDMNLFMWSFLCAIPIEIIGMNNDGFARAIEIFYIAIIILIPNIINTYGVRYCKNTYGQKYKIRWNGNQLLLTKLIAEIIVFVLVFGLYIYLLKASPIVPYKLYK
ncbi:EpsG family protein [Blautia sp. HCP3S3_H10_1]|uniref:EpsG family protein n=1 Tax=unclassified Blautia TaxID=2648079 RepID=UPI003F90C54C